MAALAAAARLSASSLYSSNPPGGTPTCSSITLAAADPFSMSATRAPPPVERMVSRDGLSFEEARWQLMAPKFVAPPPAHEAPGAGAEGIDRDAALLSDDDDL